MRKRSFKKQEKDASSAQSMLSRKPFQDTFSKLRYMAFDVAASKRRESRTISKEGEAEPAMTTDRTGSRTKMSTTQAKSGQMSVSSKSSVQVVKGPRNRLDQDVLSMKSHQPQSCLNETRTRLREFALSRMSLLQNEPSQEQSHQLDQNACIENVSMKEQALGQSQSPLPLRRDLFSRSQWNDDDDNSVQDEGNDTLEHESFLDEVIPMSTSNASSSYSSSIRSNVLTFSPSIPTTLATTNFFTSQSSSSQLSFPFMSTFPQSQQDASENSLDPIAEAYWNDFEHSNKTAPSKSVKRRPFPSSETLSRPPLSSSSLSFSTWDPRPSSGSLFNLSPTPLLSRSENTVDELLACAYSSPSVAENQQREEDQFCPSPRILQ